MCKVSTGKLLNCLSLEAYNLKTTNSRCNLKTDLNRAKAEHSSDVIFVGTTKLLKKLETLAVDDHGLYK